MPGSDDTQSQPWSKRDNFSVDRHQALQDAANAGSNFFDSTGDIIQGVFGRSRVGYKTPHTRFVFARVLSKTITPYPTISVPSPAPITLPTGYYAGRLQKDRGKKIDPTIPLVLSNYFQDISTINDCYIENMPENLTGATALPVDGSVINLGLFVGFSSDEVSAPSLPIIRFLGGGGGSLSVGQYQDQVYMMVAQNQAGWGYARGHPLT